MCLRCTFDSQAQTLCPNVTPQAGPGDRNFQREVTVVREGGGEREEVKEEEEKEEEGCGSVGVAGQQLLLSASIRKPRGDMGWRHGWGGVVGREGGRRGQGGESAPTQHPHPLPNKPKPEEECVGPPLLGPLRSPIRPPFLPLPPHTPSPSLPTPLTPSVHP